MNLGVYICFFNQKISLTTLAQIRQISEFNSDPRGAFTAMKRDIVNEVNVEQVSSLIEYMRNLRSSRVGTLEIESLAKGIMYGGRATYEKRTRRVVNWEVLGEIDRILEIRIRKEEREWIYKWKESKRAGIELMQFMEGTLITNEIQRGDLMYSFRRVKREEIDKQMGVMRESYMRKWRGMVQKRREERKVKKDSRLEGIDGMDKEVEER